MDVGPIPQLDLFEIGKLYEVDNLYEFTHIMRQIDSLYLSFVRDKSKAEANKNKKPGGKFARNNKS